MCNNIVLSQGFGRTEGIAVDTHVKRLSKLLGLTENTDPVKIERDLMEVVPKERWWFISSALIMHGRNVCIARKPRCHVCSMSGICPSSLT